MDSEMRPEGAAQKPAEPTPAPQATAEAAKPAGVPADSAAKPKAAEPVEAAARPKVAEPVEAAAKPKASDPAAKPKSVASDVAVVAKKAPPKPVAEGKTGAKAPGNEVADPVKRMPKPAIDITAPVRPRPPGLRQIEDDKVARTIKRAKQRTRQMIFGSLFVIVILPTILAALYFGFVASDQYVAYAKFSVRGEDKASVDVLGMLSGATGANSTSTDSFILEEYVVSREMVDRLQGEFNLRALYERPEADFLARAAPGIPIEEFVEYWSSMVRLNYDQFSGVLTLEVRAFSPEDAQKIASAIVDESSQLINRLSDSANRDAVAFSENELKLAEDRLAAARLAVARLRGSEGTIDPGASASAFEGRIAELEGQISSAEANIAGLTGFVSEQSPTYRLAKARLDALREQLQLEKAKVGDQGRPQSNATGEDNPGGISGQLEAFQRVQTEQEFAQQFYATALASLERARIEAKRKSLYLATFVSPAQAELAQYPERGKNVFFVFISAFLAWGIGALLYAAVKDHVV